MTLRVKKLCRRCQMPFKPAEADPVRCDACMAPQIPAQWPSDDDEDDTPEAA